MPLIHKYNTNNVKVSLTAEVATYLRSRGYDVFWHATRETDAETAGLTAPLATITLVPSFPAIPTYIRRLNSSDGGSDEIIVPAFTLYTDETPNRVASLGLGHKDYEWSRRVLIDGFADTAFQQAELADVFQDWLQSEEQKEFVIYDYATDPTTPPALDPMRVMFSHIDQLELVNENEAVRYYVKVIMLLNYEE
jgi:hypothetical protein